MLKVPVFVSLSLSRISNSIGFSSPKLLFHTSSRTLWRRKLNFGSVISAGAGGLPLHPVLHLQPWLSSRRHFSVTLLSLTSKTGGSQSPSINTSKSFKNYQSNPDGRVPSGGWFLLVIPLSTLALGVWQVFRWRWKLGLIDDMRHISVTDPVPLPEEISEIEALEYRKVQVKGQFDYSNQVLIGPRPLVDVEDSKSERQKNRGVFSSGSTKNGYHIITPFKVEGRDETILINRGWVATKSVQKYNHIQGPTEIVGIVRKTEQRAPFMAKNRPGQGLLHHRDVPAIAETLGTQEIWLDLHSVGVASSSSKALAESVPVPGQTRVTLRNEHVSYFVTWFSLSAITGLMWHRRFIRGLNLL